MPRKPAVFIVDAFRVQSQKERDARIALALYGATMPDYQKRAVEADLLPDYFAGTLTVTQRKGETVAALHQRAYDEGKASFPAAELHVQRQTTEAENHDR